MVPLGSFVRSDVKMSFEVAFVGSTCARLRVFFILSFFVLSASLGPVVTCVINAAAAARQGDWVTVNVSIEANTGDS